MATAKNCFSENMELIGSPANASREVMIQWNLNNGLRMLAEQMSAVQQDLANLQRELTRLQRDVVARR